MSSRPGQRPDPRPPHHAHARHHPDSYADEAIDPDVDLHLSAQRAETAGTGKWKILAAISAGAVLGASARYGVSLVWPSHWGTFWVNVVGCALIGVLMVLVSERRVVTHPLVRPFAGVGVLGGFTTFSTYALDVAELLERQRVAEAAGYAAATVCAAMGAVWLGATVTRRAVGR
ncbi:fluoride efflux transporter FluC [Streptomyces sp. NPDC059169]|uniref:fluoride efflux transporter FluC n=1 Tax=unclassified Streptomyces TaxID=2593676 RepID=UPI003694843F